jgi:hypothetical protein
MLRKFITFIAFLIGITQALALDLTLPAMPGGGTGRTATVIIDALKDKNVDGNIVYNQNCAIVKNQIEGGASMLYLMSAWGMQDNICKINIDNKKIKILDELYYYSLGLCYRKDRSDLGWDDFTSNRKKTIAASQVSTKTVQLIFDTMGVSKNINLITVGASGKAREVILGNDFDYTLVDSEWVGKNDDKVNCLFLGTDENVTLNGRTYNGLPQVMDEHFHTKPPVGLQDVLIVFAVNLTQQQEERAYSELQLLRTTPKWNDYVHQFGNGSVTAADNKYNNITKALQGN